MIGIDLFAGAGGMSLGAELSGVNVIAAVESDVRAAHTYSCNFKSSNVLCEDIRNVNTEKLKLNKRNIPLIIFGGPPCQGFSVSNQKTRSRKNPNNWLFLEYIRIVNSILPEWVVLENVKGILETERGDFFNYIIEHLQSIGYTLSWKVLNAMHYGVPQNRSRLFIVGTLEKKLNFNFPEPTCNKAITVKEAISDLPILSVGANADHLPYSCKPQSAFAKEMRGDLAATNGHLITRNAPYVVERYKYIPQGGNWANIPESLMSNYKDQSRCHTGIYYRLKNSEPSVVIGNYRKNMLIHPTQDRGLSVREAARLQSFPDWFEFKGTIGFQQQQVGNAVPPLLSKVVFSKIMEYC